MCVLENLAQVALGDRPPCANRLNQVQIGRGLLSGGPASLFIAFTIWCTFILALTLCLAEMVTYLPTSSPFIRLAGRYVDEAFRFAVGWNFFIYEAIMVPYGITTCNLIITYWRCLLELSSPLSSYSTRL